MSSSVATAAKNAVNTAGRNIVNTVAQVQQQARANAMAEAGAAAQQAANGARMAVVEQMRAEAMNKQYTLENLRNISEIDMLRSKAMNIQHGGGQSNQSAGYNVVDSILNFDFGSIHGGYHNPSNSAPYFYDAVHIEGSGRLADLMVGIEAELAKIGAKYRYFGWYLGATNAGIDVGVSPEYTGYDISAGLLSGGVEIRIPGTGIVIRLDGDAFSAGTDSGITWENRDGVAGIRLMVSKLGFAGSVFIGLETNTSGGGGGR